MTSLSDDKIVRRASSGPSVLILLSLVLVYESFCLPILRCLKRARLKGIVRRDGALIVRHDAALVPMLRIYPVCLRLRKVLCSGCRTVKNHCEIKKKFDETGECIRDLRDVAEALTCCRGTRLECLLKKRH